MQFAASLIALQLAFSAPPAAAPNLSCGDLPIVMLGFQQSHYARQPLDEDLERRTVAQFIKNLDPSKVLLLQKDVDALKAELPQVFETMRKGSCPALDSAIAKAVARAREDLVTVKKLLGPKYQLDESVELVLDPEKRGYAHTPEERAILVQRMAHFQVSNYLLAGLDLEKAKKQLVHRYELVIKRLENRKNNGDLPGMYAEAFASALDPHSSYMSAKTLADFQISMRLSLEGIGAALRSEDGMTVIESLVPGGQADKMNVLRPKDKIIAVSQEKGEPTSTIDMELSDVVGMIRGKKGTKVTLTILREKPETRTFDVTIVRDKIDVKEQAAKINYETRKVDGRDLKIAVLELPSFYGGDENGRSSYGDTKRLLEEAKKEKADALVLDLSKNGGGLLEDAVRISGLFIREGGVVATRDAQGRVQVLADEDESVVWSGPLVVLTSPASASASEILAGALKDYGRAVVVGGEHTFGKGTVQSLTPLPKELGALKVTTGMFFLPKGVSTQQKGVISHIVVPSILNGYDLGEKNLDHALPPQTTKPFLSDKANWSDPAKGWRPVEEAVIGQLSQRSQERVAQDAELQDIQKQVLENRKKQKVVKLSELRKKAKENGEEGEDYDSKKKFESMAASFVREGVNIAADLVQFGSGSANLGKR